VFSMMRQIAQQEGPMALWTGWQPRALWHAPAGAVCWATYEAMKRFLGVNITHVHGA
jgi:solute carrier family 25 iron transporter 28/37